MSSVVPSGRRLGLVGGALVVAERELRDQVRDWRIIAPVVLLTLFFPLFMNFTASQAVEFVGRYGAPIIGERLLPFLLMVVGFFPISISLVIALESFAGERERLTLEPLLATPLSDRHIYLGKMLSSLAMPLTAAYLGIGVYLVGLMWRIQWHPPLPFLIQVILLTTMQAVVMVSAAVVVSSQTTSVRAANLLASFVILPVAELIIGESMIMFWGHYHILWWIILGLGLIAVILGRMGLKLLNREQLLSREIDALDLRWAWRCFRQAFVRDAKNLKEWYGTLRRDSLPNMRWMAVFMVVALSAAVLVGWDYADQFRLPQSMLDFAEIEAGMMDRMMHFGLLTGQGWLWILTNNLRAIAASSLLGFFSFGVLAVVLLMAPIGIVGYFLGSAAMLGTDAVRFVLALVVPHGLVEIPAAVLAGAAVLQLGLATVSPPKDMTLGHSWLVALAEWARITLGLVVPLLVLAAAIEAFVTPRIALSFLPGV